MALFESYHRRIDQIIPLLEKYDMHSMEQAEEICTSYGVDVAKIVRDVQPICCDNAVWAYTLGGAIAIRKGPMVGASVSVAVAIEQAAK